MSRIEDAVNVKDTKSLDKVDSSPMSVQASDLLMRWDSVVAKKVTTSNDLPQLTLIVDPEQKMAIHNKQVFAQVDFDGNGRLSLTELQDAISDPKLQLTKTDYLMLSAQAERLSERADAHRRADAGHSHHSHSRSNEVTFSQYMRTDI